ncbi:MAG: ATP-binding protein [Bacteroidota bacterium]
MPQETQRFSLLFLVIASFFLFIPSAFGQKVWTEPANISLDDTVRIFVDIRQCRYQNVLGQDSLFFYSWNPAFLEDTMGTWEASHPAMAMQPMGNDVWSCELVPTEFYQEDSLAFYQEGWWFTVKAKDGGQGLPHEQMATENLAIIRSPYNLLTHPEAFRGTLTKQYHLRKLSVANRVLPDALQRKTIEEVVQAYENGQFVPHDLMPDEAYLRRPFWLHTAVQNPYKQPLTFTFSVGFLGKAWNEAEVYFRDSTGQMTRLQTGYLTSRTEKPIDDWRNFFSIRLKGGESKEIFIKAQQFASHELLPVADFLYQIDYPYLVETERGYQLMFAFMVSVLSFVILFYLLWFFMTQKKEQAYFSLLWTGFLLSLLVPAPLGYYLAINEVYPLIKNFFDLSVAWLLMSSLTLWGILGFSIHYLDIHHYYPKAITWAKWLSFAPMLVFVLAGVNFLFPEWFPYDPRSWEGFIYFPSTIVRSVLLGSGFVFAFGMGMYVYAKGFRPALYFLIAFLPLTMASLVVSISNIQTAVAGESIGLPADFNLFNNISMLAALILFALAMGDKQRKLERERRVAQKELLSTQQQAYEEQKKANDRLRQMDALKDQFLANTSHELRTPLTGIIGLSESLMDHERDAEKQENLGMIISSGRRLSSLVNDILDFSKLQHHQLELRLKPVDLYSLAQGVIRLQSATLEQAALQLDNQISPDLPPVWGDEDRLEQIFFNLIGNAVKFTERGTVTVSAMLQPGQIEVAVKDTGIGIPKDKRKAIFQAFEQADGSIQREFAGTGLGLSISKQLTELHGGSMWVESKMGEGSTFFFCIPLAVEFVDDPVVKARINRKRSSLPLPQNRYTPATEPGTLPPAKRSSLSSTEPEEVKEHLRIMVVDDEPINQQVIKNHLTGEAYEVLQAMNGMAALALLEQGEEVDLIVLDAMMPRMSGYEVCQKIREQYLPSELPIIMVTAKNQIADLVHGLDIGANDYLPKPFSKEEFLARIKTHLNLRQINSVSRRFVPTEFIRSLGKSNLMEVRLGDQVEKRVTVFFSDIRNYTGLAENMSPEENFRFVNAYAGRMGPIIRHHQGFVNQYLGDGIMAIFQHSPDDALQSAIEMQQALKRYNTKRISLDRYPIKVGIGLHTGSLVMGIIGDSQRTDAATISDTVNTASRMEGLTKTFGANVLLTAESVSGLQHLDRYHLRYLGKTLVKGKQAPVGVYECFDSDEAVQQELKTSYANRFAEALHLQLEAEPVQAQKIWEELTRLNPEDQVIQHFLQQARLRA